MSTCRLPPLFPIDDDHESILPSPATAIRQMAQRLGRGRVDAFKNG